MRRRAFLTLLALVAALVTGALSANAPALASEKGDFILRFGPTLIDPSGKFQPTLSRTIIIPDPGGDPTLDITRDEVLAADITEDSTFGAFVALEWRATDIIGIELFAAQGTIDVSGSISSEFTEVQFGSIIDEGFERRKVVGELGIVPIGLAINVHNRFGTWDFWLGPVITYALADDLDFDEQTYSTSFEQDWGWNIGIAAPLNESGSLRLSVVARYMRITAETTIDPFEDDQFNIDPYFGQIGLDWRF